MGNKMKSQNTSNWRTWTVKQMTTNSAESKEWIAAPVESQIAAVQTDDLAEDLRYPHRMSFTMATALAIS